MIGLGLGISTSVNGGYIQITVVSTVWNDSLTWDDNSNWTE